MKRFEIAWLLPGSFLIGVDQSYNEDGEQAIELCLGFVALRFVLKERR
jgi:hypothetical protein